MKIRPKRVGPYCKMEVQAEEKGKFPLHSGKPRDTFWCGVSQGWEVAVESLGE